MKPTKKTPEKVNATRTQFALYEFARDVVSDLPEEDRYLQRYAVSVGLVEIAQKAEYKLYRFPLLMLAAHECLDLESEIGALLRVAAEEGKLEQAAILIIEPRLLEMVGVSSPN